MNTLAAIACLMLADLITYRIWPSAWYELINGTWVRS